MKSIKTMCNFIVRQILSLLLAAALIVGTILGSAVAGVALALFLLVCGVCFAMLGAFGPLIGLTAGEALKQKIEDLKEAAEKLEAATKAGNVTPLKR
jgi:hypothetical protein